jgi:hypothetical protein
MNNQEQWYIVKETSGHCQIIASEQESLSEGEQTWGPFVSAEEALARRVGLIRAGKCKPVIK